MCQGLVFAHKCSTVVDTHVPLTVTSESNSMRSMRGWPSAAASLNLSRICWGSATPLFSRTILQESKDSRCCQYFGACLFFLFLKELRFSILHSVSRLPGRAGSGWLQRYAWMDVGSVPAPCMGMLTWHKARHACLRGRAPARMTQTARLAGCNLHTKYTEEHASGSYHRGLT